MAIRRALLSVTQKEGIVELAQALAGLGVEIISTGGTAALLARAGIFCIDVSAFTGSPEMLDGRVKTLHPKVYGGILARRDLAHHQSEMERFDLEGIDLVCVNLYAFEEAAARRDLAFDEVVEQIDIGGPSMLRAAAKNHAFVVPVCDPRDYGALLDAMRSPGGIPLAFRRKLALKVFRHTAAYDRAIEDWLSRQVEGEAPQFPDTLALELRRVQSLRYGENPHQAASFYREAVPPPATLATARQLGGKALSYNNLLDGEAALQLVIDLGQTSCVFVKHNNPCGAASRPELADAIRAARASDPVSAFGAVVAVSKPVDMAAAAALSETFIEVVLAPAFTDEAVEMLEAKKNLRLLEVGPLPRPLAEGLDMRRVRGGMLVQTWDAVQDLRGEVLGARVATIRPPTEEELQALAFNWVVAKHVRSNAIVFGHADRTVAVGAGQMSRVDSVHICRHKAGDALRGTAVASDAFFPFRDGVDLIAAAGATAIAQPGGSVRDDEVIAAANAHGLAMVLTGVRHFRH